MARTQDDVTKGMAFSIQAANITAEIFAKTLRDFLDNKDNFTIGKTSLDKLHEKSRGQLYSEKVSANNIGAFTETAKKYDLSYALKKDKSTEPPTWNIFIASDKGSKDSFDRAFREFTDKILNPKEQDKPIITRDTLHLVEEIQTEREAQHEPEHETPDIGIDER